MLDNMMEMKTANLKKKKTFRKIKLASSRNKLPGKKRKMGN